MFVTNGGNEAVLAVQVPASKLEIQKEREMRRRRRN